MTVSRAVDVPPPHAASAEARAWAFAVAVATLWVDVLFESARHGSGISLTPSLAALAGLGTQLAWTAAEAAIAVRAWGFAGSVVRWRELFPRLLTVSSLEALAAAIAAGHTTLPRSLAVWLAGPRAAAAAMPLSGPAYAFSGFGALALVRLLLSAQAQAGVTRRPYARALAVVLVLYLATRLAMWWSFDLMRGRSFQWP